MNTDRSLQTDKADEQPSPNRDKSSAMNDKNDRIREIINREFKKEFKNKEEEALKIENEISKTKKILQKLRYAIISNYYRTGSTEAQTQIQLQIQQNSIVTSGIQEFDQMPIHPSLKKLIGKKPINYHEIIKSGRATRKAAREATSVACEHVVKAKESKATVLIETVASTDEDLKITQLTSSRGKNLLQHTIVIGNTSQYLREQTSSNMTHKWMCYVKTKSAVKIERLIKKVRFHLDHSYKPNNIVDVNRPPFHLTRRGYRDFPIEILIFFQDELQVKPVRIFHQLVLDTKHTGHQILGNETVSELWTRNILDDKDLSQNLEEIKISSQIHLMDHDYYKFDQEFDGSNASQSKKCISDDSIKNTKSEQEKVSGRVEDIKGMSNQHQEVNQWIESNFPNFVASGDERNFHIHIQDKELPILNEFDFVQLPENLELERRFVEDACLEIKTDSSKMCQSSKFLLITLLRSFVKQLVENAYIQSCTRNDKVVEKLDVKKALLSRAEFDFLR